MKIYTSGILSFPGGRGSLSALVYQNDKESEVEDEIKILWEVKINNRTTLFLPWKEERGQLRI